jgi:hypothetical protein
MWTTFFLAEITIYHLVKTISKIIRELGDQNNDQEYPENGLQFEDEEDNEEEDSKCPISIFINDNSEGMYIGSICDEKNGMILGVCEKIYLFYYFETCLDQIFLLAI